MRQLIFACCVLIGLATCGCSRYNYKAIFPLNQELWGRAQKIAKADAFLIHLKEDEFANVQKELLQNAFVKWHPLENASIYSGKLQLNERTHTETDPKSVLFSTSRRIDGVVPVAVYYPKDNLLYMLLADAII